MATLKNTIINDTGYITMPSGTTDQRPSPVAGMLRYNTDIQNIEYYNGSKWQFSDQGSGYTKSNLTLYLDAGNTSSYTGNGTKWYDLSGNNKHALMSASNPPVFTSVSGVDCFQATDLSGQNFYVSNYTFPTTGRTYECWIYQTAVNIGYQTWMDDNLSERVLFGLLNDSFIVYPSISLASQITTGVWYQVAFTMVGDVGSTVISYKNGASIGSGTYGYNLASGTGTLYIMGDTGGEVMSGYCAIVRTYNRVLSAAEILQNFNADRARFGL